MSTIAKVPFLDEGALDLPVTQGVDYPEGRGPALPANNSDRVATLQNICSATAAIPEDIDAILEAMSVALDCETCCVSLLTSTQTVISNGTGLLHPRMSLPLGICHWSLVPQDAQTIIVEDMLEDERMSCHWLVGRCPTVRFYVASPLIAANQHRIGTLCLLDTKPRQFTPSSAAILNNFSELVIRELEAAWVESTAADDKLQRGAGCYNQPYMVVDIKQEGGRILYMSKAAHSITGAGQNRSGATLLDDVFCHSNLTASLRADLQPDNKSALIVRGVMCRQQDRNSMSVDILIRPANVETVDDAALPIGIPSGTCSEGEQPGSVTIVFMFLKPAGFSLKGKPHIPIKGLRLGHLLGIGSFARVYRGLLNGKPVAVKIAGDIRDSGTLDGVPREAAIMSALDHPCIVRQITHASAGAARGRPSYSEATQQPEIRLWMVLEFCDEGSLGNAMARGCFLKQRGPGEGPDICRGPALDVILHTALEIAKGMAYMHLQDIIHCDLSKGNILLKGSDLVEHGFSAKIADFGLSRMTADDQEPDTETGTVIYKSPESLNSGVFSKASDVYAFGVLLWELYMGHPAWTGLSAAQLTYAILIGKQTLPIPWDAPVAFKQLIENLLGEACLRFSFADIVEVVEGCIAVL